MFRPRIPVNPLPTGLATPPAVIQPSHVVPTAPAPVPVAPASAPAAQARPTVQLTPGSLALLVGGGTVAVLVIGAVLVSMLLAVAITAGSLAVVALVVRSVLTHPSK